MAVLVDFQQLLVGFEVLESDVLDDLLDDWFFFLGWLWGRLGCLGLFLDAVEEGLIFGMVDQLGDNLVNLLMDFVI